MLAIPAFGPWSEQDHVGKKQEGMIARAQLAETTPIPGTVDSETQTAKFYGSKIYDVSLDHCPCGGFRGKFPCKHIYRLAMELGIIDLPYKTGTPKGERLQEQIAWQDAVAEIEKISENAQRELQNMLSQKIECRHDLHLFIDPEIITELRACPLLDERPAVELILSRMKRAELNEVIAKSSAADPPKKNAASAVLSQWLLDNVPDLSDLLPPYAAFAFIENFDRGQRMVYSYLSRKFDYDHVFLEDGYIGCVPHGSNSPGFSIEIGADGITSVIDGDPNTFYFPDDSITDLLTKYGHNRCLNGFVPVKE